MLFHARIYVEVFCSYFSKTCTPESITSFIMNIATIRIGVVLSEKHLHYVSYLTIKLKMHVCIINTCDNTVLLAELNLS